MLKKVGLVFLWALLFWVIAAVAWFMATYKPLFIWPFGGLGYIVDVVGLYLIFSFPLIFPAFLMFGLLFLFVPFLSRMSIFVLSGVAAIWHTLLHFLCVSLIYRGYLELYEDLKPTLDKALLPLWIGFISGLFLFKMVGVARYGKKTD